jgi:hypothetical protein
LSQQHSPSGIPKLDVPIGTAANYHEDLSKRGISINLAGLPGSYDPAKALVAKDALI